MTTKQKLITKAKELGVEVYVELDWGFHEEEKHIELRTPAGIIFEATGCHAAVTCDYNLREVYRAAYEDLIMGIRPCIDPHCEVCNEK